MMRPATEVNRIGGLATTAGLAAAVVPFAVLVHLIAEALSLGVNALGPAFVLRHLYLAVLFLATAAWSGRTLGIGFAAAERRRRCAIIGAQLRNGKHCTSAASLVLANMAFFCLSQIAEGVPIASGDWCLGLIAALIGSALCAMFVSLFGRSLVIAALVAVTVSRIRHSAQTIRTSDNLAAAPRCASTAFSLFIPNRPPPL